MDQPMKIPLGQSKLLLTMIWISLVCTAWGAPESIPESWQPMYDHGVEAYRDGHYSDALKQFRQITQNTPESVEGRYYLAITLAQLGRFKEAREAYESVIKLAPESETATLARQGIDYLPQPDDLDAPPLFKRSAQQRPSIPSASEYIQENMKSNGTEQNQAAQNPMGNLDPQALQMMMMMGSMGGGGGSGGSFNPMMIPLLQNLGRGSNGGNGSDPQQQIPPDVFSTMMMNQMMQDFSPFSSGKDD